MEKANVNFEVMLGSAEKAREVLGGLKQFADTTPFEFPEVQEAAKKLLAFNTPASELKSTLRSLGDIAAGVDAPIGEIAEIYGKARVQGRLFQEDINQLTGRGIPIIQELAKQFKVSDGEVKKLVETGKVGFPNIQKAFADLTSEGGKFSGLMEKQSKTLPGLLSTALDAVKGFATDIGTEIVQQFNLKEALASFGEFIAGLRQQFSALSPATKQVILAVGAFAIALGPVLVAIGAVLTALPTLTLAFGVLTGPVGIAIGVLAGAAALIIANWDSLVAYFGPSGEGGRLFGELAASVSESVAEIMNALNSLSVGDTFGDLISAADIFRTLFREIAVGIRAISDVIGGVIGGITRLLQGDLPAAAEQAKRALSGLVAPLANLLGFTEAPPQGTGLSSYFADLTNKALGVAGGIREAVGELNTFTPAVAAISDDMQSALNKVRQSLLENVNLSKALGQMYDYISGRGAALESGIKSLISAGFAPASAVVQGYVKQLRDLAVATDAMASRASAGVSAPKVEEQKVAFGGLDFGSLPTQLPTVDITPFTAPLQEATSQMAQFQATGEAFTAGLNEVLVTGLQNIAVGIGEAIGQMAIGAGGMELVGAALLSGIGSMAIDLGKLAIATGVAALGIKEALSSLNPALAIAGGIALVALGTAVRGAAGRITGGGSGGAPSPSFASSPMPKSYTPPTSQSRNTAPAPPTDITHTINVLLTAKGSDLSQVMELHVNRQGRIVGRKV
ncbi:tape measure protein [Hymenobacter sp. BT594]|uniref:Tape measure protein n=2 Tax=Hymenobacter guriensis TaxID=2793065 RepID=A0ABS0KYS8_9BACT|nr:tape measure protein [Hymenobacter guriensis]